jgi:hypothetical protein
MADPVACLECHAKVGLTRGLCDACYQRLRALVRCGKATWAQVEAAGRCHPAAKTSWRKPRRED